MNRMKKAVSAIMALLLVMTAFVLPASVKAAGYRKRANMKKQTQMVSRRVIMESHPLQCLLIPVYVCFFDFMFLNYTIAMGVVKSLFGAR